MTSPTQTVECPYCREVILPGARKCKHCGEYLDHRLRSEPMSTLREGSGSKSNPGIAAVLSLVIPGAGQMYRGHLGAGFAWLIGTVIGYVLLVVPGLVLHIACIVNAYSDGSSDD